MRRHFPISLVMIVRDEEATLDRCLASVQGLVDEIVVVDTGSTDATIAIAESYGAKVSHFTWIDDFSAARNHALAKATHPWRLVLDADEWIADRAAAADLFDKLGRAVPDFIGLIGMLQARPDGTLNDGVVPMDLGRLLPRQVSYTGRVHEQPTPELRLVDLGLLVGHDGYTPEALARKEGRNVELLTAAIEEEPDNGYLWYQLGSEFSTRRRYEEALPFLVQAFNLIHPENPDAAPAQPLPWWHRLTVRLMLTLTALGRHGEAAAVGDMESARWRESSDFHYVHGRALRELAGTLGTDQDAYAEQLILASLNLWVRAVELGDRAEFTGTLPVRATVLAARRVAEDYATMGRQAEAERYRAIAEAA